MDNTWIVILLGIIAYKLNQIYMNSLSQKEKDIIKEKQKRNQKIMFWILIILLIIIIVGFIWYRAEVYLNNMK